MPKALGGLPRLARAGARAVVRPAPPPVAPATSRAMMNDLLRRKGFWLGDVDEHPLCVGVPIGRDGPQGAVSVDVGLKNMASLSMSQLADVSPQIKQQLLERAAPLDAPVL
eukprot:3209380-Prymnesium_polylepis.1